MSPLIYMGKALEKKLRLTFVTDAGVFMLPYKFAGIITAAGYIGDGAVGVITRPHSEESEEEEFNLFVVLEAKVPGHGRDIFIDSYPSRDVALARLRNL